MSDQNPEHGARKPKFYDPPNIASAVSRPAPCTRRRQAADGLEIEITESMVMRDANHSIATLEAIRAMGLKIAIDDLGTGFSSLSYLSKLPIDTLKIDRSFIIDMTSGPAGLALVSSVVNLAHSLKLNVVAEGVETEEQRGLLLELNCNQMQGFLFSRPIPCDEFERRYVVTIER